MPKKVLAALGVLVVGAAIALWLALRSDDTPTAPAADHPADPPAQVAATDHAGGAPPSPALPAGGPGDAAVTTDDAGVRSYTVGGIQVRDHRAGSQTPMDIPPNIHPPAARRLPSTLTHAISQQLEQVMRDCVASLPREARGKRPRLEGQIVVAIKDHQLSVTKSTMQLRNVSGAPVDSIKSCIEQRSIGLTTPAADQADLDTYSIGISFAIP